MVSNMPQKPPVSVFYDGVFEQLKTDMKARGKEVLNKNSKAIKKVLKEQVGQSIEATIPYVSSTAGMSAEAISSKPIAAVALTVAGQSTEAVGKKIANGLIDESVDSGAPEVMERAVDSSVDAIKSVFSYVMDGLQDQPHHLLPTPKATMFSIANECLHSWSFDDCRVDLIQTDGELKYELVQHGGVIKENDIAIPPSKNLEEMIASLKKCCALLDGNESVFFSYVYYTKNVEDHTVSLIRGDGDLMWKIYDITTKQHDIISFRAFTIPSLHCHPDTVALIEGIRQEPLPLKHIEHLVNDFRVVRIRDNPKEITRAIRVGTTNLASTLVAAGISPILLVSMAFGATAWFENKNTSNENINSYARRKERSEQNELIVEIEPICFPSFIDSRLFVSKFTWAVTLVTHSGSAGNHTEIIIEGINDGFFDENSNKLYRSQNVAIGEKFAYLAHFTGKRIDYGLVSEKELQYETRTEIWMRPRDKIKTLIKNMETAAIPVFAFAGKDALHARGAHSCFTWASEHLQAADIFLEKSWFGKIFTYPKNYTAKPEYYLKQPVEIQI